jgi:hypothetical protein
MQINDTITSGQTYSTIVTDKNDSKNNNNDSWTQRITALGVKHANEVAENYYKGDYRDITSQLTDIQSLYRRFMESRGGVWKGFNPRRPIEEIRENAGIFVENEHIKEFTTIYRGAMNSELSRLGVDKNRLINFAADNEILNITV